MKLVTSQQMMLLEKKAIEEYNIPSLILMENAAYGFCTEFLKNYDISGKKIAVFCGKGANGGDGFAIARHLKNIGADITVVTAFDASSLPKGDSLVNYTIAKKMNIPFLSELTEDFSFDCIIDAIFGTGFKIKNEFFEENYISYINKSGAFVASVDIPSGFCATSGKSGKTFVSANLTITFCLAKLGHFLYPARNHTGKLVVVPISVPKDEILALNTSFATLDDEILRKLPERSDFSHKGTFGKALCVVGSCGMSGAAVLSTAAAFATESVLRSGAGMVTCATDSSTVSHIISHTPEAMTLNLDAEENKTEAVLNAIEKNDVVLVGCGIGKSELSRTLTEKIVTSAKKPLVLDADGINNIAENIDILKSVNSPLILTPHLAEFGRIIGKSPDYVEENRIKLSKEFSSEYSAILVLKGANTTITSPSGEVYVCADANSALATAGSGDVLSGIITGLLAQGTDPFKAACCGVYIHSRAGRIASDENGAHYTKASDIIENIKKVLLPPFCQRGIIYEKQKNNESLG